MADRRDFIKKTGLALGLATIAAKGMAIDLITTDYNKTELTSDQKVFLSKFRDWVNDCIVMVEEEKQEKRLLKNNPKIMDLAAEAGKWMPQAKDHLKDPAFQKHFLEISNKLTEAITPEYHHV